MNDDDEISYNDDVCATNMNLAKRRDGIMNVKTLNIPQMLYLKLGHGTVVLKKVYE